MDGFGGSDQSGGEMLLAFPPFSLEPRDEYEEISSSFNLAS